MSGPGAPSPLAAAALVLVAPGTDADGLVERFLGAGASIDRATAGALLTELAGLGLVRVATGSGPTAHFVPTSLGTELLGSWPLTGAPTELTDLERLRTDLLATIAHELRTPLTAVRTSVGLLRAADARPTEEQQAMLLAAIERNAERMQRVVEDILDLARFRAGEIRLQLRRFDALELATDAVASLEPLAREREVELRVLPPSAGISVYGDRRRLEQALVNLVSNAVRHGRRVEVSVERRGDGTAWAVLDDGPGIPPEHRARLFERFFVGRSDRTGRREGVGLGLPTALAIAQAHGGTIEVDSAPGAGSTFTLVVPTDGPAGVEEDA
jgi:signal transduction histidine kinase